MDGWVEEEERGQIEDRIDTHHPNNSTQLSVLELTGSVGWEQHAGGTSRWY